jgi:asparagine synthase (glutamine-hydrolysing)
MCAALTHRGPDGEGYYFDSDIGLGMRRLKVIDLETGQQPVFNESRSVTVVYNGEIYNYRELRKSLEERGHRFASRGDTEVITHLYEEFGDRCVDHLRGMFAFALWDRERRRLLLARDRLGIKPLYYWQDNGRLVFASEIKAILKCDFVDRRLRPAALHDYFSYLYVPGPGTVYEEIRELEPACTLVFQDKRSSISEYWKLPRPETGSVPDMRSAADELKDRISEAVRISLVSDVPVGVFLSGGLDSAVVVGMMARHSSKKIQTFSIGFSDVMFSELEQARTIARHYNTDHHEFVLKPPSPEDLIDMLAVFDEPFADSSAIPTHVVSQIAREHVTVALSGDGGDEVFGGYNNYRADKLAELYRMVPRSLRAAVTALFCRNGLDRHDRMAFRSKLFRIMAAAEMDRETGHVWWLRVMEEDIKSELYRSPDLLRLVGSPSTRHEERFQNGSDDFINECIAVDFKTVLPSDYLKKSDRASMASSLELRVPLLDHHLVEFAMRLPSRYKVQHLMTKVLLRKSMQSELPHEILSGRKRGFSIPLSNWLRTEWSDLVHEYLSRNAIDRDGYFNYGPIGKMVEEHSSGQRDHGKSLWTLLCFQIWLEHSRN